MLVNFNVYRKKVSLFTAYYINNPWILFLQFCWHIGNNPESNYIEITAHKSLL